MTHKGIKQLANFFAMIFMAEAVGMDSKEILLRRTTRRLSEVDIKNKEIENMQVQGLKKFIIDGQLVYAINKKNAERKAKKVQQPVA
jgi:hypothetical protein